jgi:hypothetical protein
MAYLAETDLWETGIYQFEEADVVQGGPAGIDNVPTHQLANRTLNLKNLIAALSAGKLDSAALASQAQAVAGTDNATWMTPLRVAQAIATLLVSASETVAGKVELATAAETVTGTDSVRATHPAGVKSAISSAISALVASSPSTLDTLNELAAALGNDPNFATSITTLLGLKAPLASPALTGNPTAPTPTAGDNDTSIATTAFVQNALASASVGSVQGSFSNLKSSATGTNALIALSADEIVVEDAANAYKTLRGVALTINSATVGSNGLDTGVLAANTWYSRWIIYNPSTLVTAGLLSLSGTAPTLPSGFTGKAITGWVKTDPTANKFPLIFKQIDRSVQHGVAAGSNQTVPPAACVGVQGTWSVTAPVWQQVSIAAFVSPTASKIKVGLVSSYNNAAQTNVVVAPNSSYGGTRTSNCPPLSVTQNGGSAAASDVVTGDLLLESMNIFVQCQTANGSVVVYGYEDNF